MSKEYREKFGVELVPTTTAAMRVLSSRPGTVDEQGDIVYFTEQSHKASCDINKIVRKYSKTGVIEHVSRIEAAYGDMTGDEYKTMVDRVIKAREMFDALPSAVRKRFNQSPAALLGFMENPANRDEAITLGLIDRQWTPATDGLGEHVPLGANVKDPKAVEPKP